MKQKPQNPLTTPAENEVARAEEALVGKIGAGFRALAYTEKEQEELSKATKEIITSYLQELPQEELSPENYQKLLKTIWPRIREKYEEKGLSFNPAQADKLTKELAEKSQEEASILTKTAPRPLPKELLTKLAATPEGVAFWPAYPLLYPPMALSLMRRGVYGPMKKILEMAASRATPETREIWQEMVEKGLFAEDLETSIAALREAGLPASHPTIRRLEAKRARFLAVQKVEGKDKPAVRILKGYYQLPKLTGRHQIYVPEAGIFLPQLTPFPKPSGYSLRLRQALNQLGTISQLYHEVKLAPGKTVIRPYLAERLMRSATGQRYGSFSHLLRGVHRKTSAKVLAALGKSTLGKPAKESLKKAATWIASKLGVKVVAAIAAAAGPPGAIINAVLLVIEKAIKYIWNKFLKPVVSWITRAIKKPEKAVGMVAVGAAIAVFISGPIGVALIFIGGLGLLSFGIASAGAVAGSFAAAVTAFFALLAVPIAAPIALFVVGVLGTLAVITFFIVMTTAGAFIVPTAPAPTISAAFEVIKNVDRNEIPNDELPDNPCVTYTVTVNAQQPIIITSVIDERTVTCTGPAPRVETPIEIPHPTEPITSWTSEPYELCFDPSFADCRVCNTVTVVANVVDGPTGQINSDTTCVNIGSPPEDCPQGWPTDSGYITQGPNANYSHQGQEAIDIGVPIGTPVKSTHEGDVVEAAWGTGVVKVRGTCDGKTFITLYVHLQSKEPRAGDHIYRGDPIGTSGTGGTGPHLHYEFEGLEMASPYIPIPDDILEGCCQNLSICPTLCSDFGIRW